MTLLVAAMSVAAYADIQNPPRPGPTRKLASGAAKIVFSSAYIVDSVYDKIENESGTAAASYGMAEGVSKAVVSTSLGVWEVLSFPFPTPSYRPTSAYPPFKHVYDLPPADLRDNCY